MSLEKKALQATFLVFHSTLSQAGAISNPFLPLVYFHLYKSITYCGYMGCFLHEWKFDICLIGFSNNPNLSLFYVLCLFLKYETCSATWFIGKH